MSFIRKVITLNIYILTSIEQPYSIIESKWPWHNFRKQSPPPSSQLHARPPFGHLNQSSPIFVTSVYKWASQFGFILTVWWRKIQSKIEGDNRLWNNNAAVIACLFQLIEIKNSHIAVLFAGSTHKCSVPKYSCYSRVLPYSHLNSWARADTARSWQIWTSHHSFTY